MKGRQGLSAKNLPEFEGDPVADLLDEDGTVPGRRIIKAGLLAGAPAVALLMVFLLGWPGLVGRLAPVLALPFVWMLAWTSAGRFINSAHDVEFRRRMWGKPTK